MSAKVATEMIDPLDIVRAVATLTAAIVVGCGVLNWYTRNAHATKGGAIWRTRAAGLIVAAAGIGVVATALGAIGAAAAAVAAADSHAFSFNGPVLETYLMQTGVGHISILQFGSAVVACMLAGLAWVTLKKTPASDLLLLTAALAAGFGQAVVPFASHPTTLDPRWIGLAAAIAHRLALSVWLGGLPALILLIGRIDRGGHKALRRGNPAPLFACCHRRHGRHLSNWRHTDLVSGRQCL